MRTIMSIRSSTPTRPASARHRRRTALVIAGVALGLLACGGDRRDKPSGPVADVPTRPADDGGAPDAAAPEPDDSGLVLRDVSGKALCTYTEDDSMAFAASPSATDVSLAQSGERMALAYHDDNGERALQLLSLTDAPRAGARQRDSDASSGVRIVAAGDGFALSYWRDGALHVERVDLEGDSVDAPAALGDFSAGRTTSMLAARDRIYIALRGDDGMMLAHYPHDDPGAVSQRALPGAADPDHAALARLGDAVWLAWSSAQTLSMQDLDDGEPVVLAEGVSGPFDIAAGAESGAVAYSYRIDDAELVRYRPFRLSGDVTLEPRAVQHPPAVLRDVAIAAFGRGYAISYRSLTSRDFDHNAIRIAFMTATGQIVYEGEVTPTSRAGGQTDLVATEDGHVVIAWTDTDDNQARLQRLDCPLALQLCNAEMDSEMDN